MTPTPRTTQVAERAGKTIPLNHTVNVKRPRKQHYVKKKVDGDKEPDTNAVWQTTDHDYIKTRQDKMEYSLDYVHLQSKIQKLEKENEKLRSKVLCLETVNGNDVDFQFWTNMPNYDVFNSLAEYLEERSGGKLKYWN